MEYQQKINSLPNFDLQAVISKLLNSGVIHWPGNRQICLNATQKNSDNFLEGTGSLYYDWDKKVLNKDKDGNDTIFVPERESKLEESDFQHLCTQFQRTEFETIYNLLEERYVLGRVRLMLLKPKTCLSWHTDTSKRLHYPIKTQKGCFMNVNGELNEMLQDNWYLIDTTVEHTAVNASKEDRIHLVACILAEKHI